MSAKKGAKAFLLYQKIQTTEVAPRNAKRGVVRQVVTQNRPAIKVSRSEIFSRSTFLSESLCIQSRLASDCRLGRIRRTPPSPSPSLSPRQPSSLQPSRNRHCYRHPHRHYRYRCTAPHPVAATATIAGASTTTPLPPPSPFPTSWLPLSSSLPLEPSQLRPLQPPLNEAAAARIFVTTAVTTLFVLRHSRTLLVSLPSAIAFFTADSLFPH